MYPSQTSLIPVAVAVVRFIESGHSLWNSWYPYWYLGLPAKFILGPAVPALLVLVHRILPILIVGTGALILANAWIEDEKRGKVKASKLLGGAKKTFKILLASLILVTFWYSPGYCLAVLFNPSIGGASAIKVLIRIFDILRSG